MATEGHGRVCDATQQSACMTSAFIHTAAFVLAAIPLRAKIAPCAEPAFH
jgi:hypothetical protein